MKCSLRPTLFCICLGIGTLPRIALAQDCSNLFDAGQLLTFEISMWPPDWDQLRFDCPNGVCPIPHTYYAAYLKCSGEPDSILIGIRRKNDKAEPSEADPQKVSLKLDINRFLSTQTFHGKKKLSLENGSDLQLVREGTAWQVYQASGAVAGRSAWVRVVVNGNYIGLYSNVEQVDKTFLTDRGILDNGFLFKKHGEPNEQRTREAETSPFAFNWYPFDHEPYPSEGPAPPDWRDQSLWRVDMTQLMTFAVAENVIANTDGAIQKGNNFWWYDWSVLPNDDPLGQQPRLYFPWDLDTSLRSEKFDLPILDSGKGHMQDGLIEELDESGVPFGQPTFQADYFTAYKSLINGPLSLAAMTAIADSIEPVISAAMDADPYHQIPWTAAVEFQDVRQMMENRFASIVSQMVAAGLGYPLETLVVGNGSVSRNPDKATIFEPGEMVQLTAVPAAGWAFDSWTGDVAGAQNPLVVTMNDSLSVTAVFVGVTAVAGNQSGPTACALSAARPNPFREGTMIEFELPRAERARLSIFDVSGRLVKTLSSGEMEPGRYRPVWDGRDDLGRRVSAGVYLVRLESESFSATRKVVRLR